MSLVRPASRRLSSGPLPRPKDSACYLKGAHAEDPMTDEERRTAAEALFRSWGSKAIEEIGAERSDTFCAEIRQISMNNVFAGLWTREGLDLRSRSLVTLGILIALHAYDE